MVWMRTAGLPNFRKLYGRSITPNLDAGTWQIDVRSRTAHRARTPGQPPTALDLTHIHTHTHARARTALRLHPRRVRRRVVWRHQVRGPVDDIVAGRQEPVPGHRIHCRWRRLPVPGCRVPDPPQDQAAVRLRARLARRRVDASLTQRMLRSAARWLFSGSWATTRCCRGTGSRCCRRRRRRRLRTVSMIRRRPMGGPAGLRGLAKAHVVLFIFPVR